MDHYLLMLCSAPEQVDANSTISKRCREVYHQEKFWVDKLSRDYPSAPRCDLTFSAATFYKLFRFVDKVMHCIDFEESLVGSLICSAVLLVPKDATLAANVLTWALLKTKVHFYDFFLEYFDLISTDINRAEFEEFYDHFIGKYGEPLLELLIKQGKAQAWHVKLVQKYTTNRNNPNTIPRPFYVSFDHTLVDLIYAHNTFDNIDRIISVFLPIANLLDSSQIDNFTKGIVRLIKRDNLDLAEAINVLQNRGEDFGVPDEKLAEYQHKLKELSTN